MVPGFYGSIIANNIKSESLYFLDKNKFRCKQKLFDKKKKKIIKPSPLPKQISKIAGSLNPSSSKKAISEVSKYWPSYIKIHYPFNN